MLTTLQRLLPMAEKIIDRRSSLPILKHICISGGMARFTDLESILLMPVPDQRSFTIPVGLLKKVLAAKPERLEFLVDEEKMVIIIYGDKMLTYPGFDVDQYPLLPEAPFEAIGTWSWDIFKVLLTQSAYCSKDDLKPSLNGVHVVQKDGQFKSSATDGHVLRVQNGMDVGQVKSTAYSWTVSVTDGALHTDSDALCTFVTPATLDIDLLAGVPMAFALHQNYPNPFNPTTTMQFDLPEATDVHLVIYDLRGRVVREMTTGFMNAGYHLLVWDAKNNNGGQLPSGVYIARLVTPKFTHHIKMVLLK